MQEFYAKLSISLLGLLTFVLTTISDIAHLFMFYLFVAFMDIILGILVSKKILKKLKSKSQKTKFCAWFSPKKFKKGIFKMFVMLSLILIGEIFDKIHFEFIPFSVQKVLLFTVLMYEFISIYKNLKLLGYDLVKMFKSAFKILANVKDIVQ